MLATHRKEKNKMIYFIEGCTCAGKTTLCRETLAHNPDWIMAPEHTPQIVENESAWKRQNRIFDDYITYFEELLAIPEKTFLADFSPLGVIPFTLALADCNFFNAKWYELFGSAHAFLTRWRDFYHEHKNELVCLAFLTEEPGTIAARLKERHRPGDEVWEPAFIKVLCYHYDQTREHYAKEFNLC